MTNGKWVHRLTIEIWNRIMRFVVVDPRTGLSVRAILDGNDFATWIDIGGEQVAANSEVIIQCVPRHRQHAMALQTVLAENSYRKVSIALKGGGL